MTRPLLILAGAGAAVTLIAGCGGGVASDARWQAAGDRGMVEFTTCMRAHGVAMDDPIHRAGHVGLSIQLPVQDAATAAAYHTCGRYLQPIIEERKGARPSSRPRSG